MIIKIRVAPLLHELIKIPLSVNVSGNTVGECLNDLLLQYPVIRDFLFDRNEVMRVLISINNKDVVSIESSKDMDRGLNDDDEIYLLALFTGG